MEEVSTEEKQPADEICAEISAQDNINVPNEDGPDVKDCSIKDIDISDVEGQFEECIRDLCMIRKTMPHKCAKLLEDTLEVLTPDFENYKSKLPKDHDDFKYDCENFRKSLTEFKEIDGSFKDIKSVDFKSLEERCKDLVKLTEVKKGMGLNDTQELLFGHKRKADANSNTMDDKLEHVVPPGNDTTPMFSTPVPLNKQGNAGSSKSMIPVPKKDKMTPVTPISRPASLRKDLLKKSHGKT